MSSSLIKGGSLSKQFGYPQFRNFIRLKGNAAQVKENEPSPLAALAPASTTTLNNPVAGALAKRPAGDGLSGVAGPRKRARRNNIRFILSTASDGADSEDDDDKEDTHNKQ